MNYKILIKRLFQVFKTIFIVFSFIIIYSCSEDNIGITNPKDYDRFLSTDHNESFENANKEIAFWSKRLRPDSTGIGDLIPLANSYVALFETTGNIQYLKDAEVLMTKAYSLPSLNKDVYGRTLAHNYIAQHRFKEALHLLEAIHGGISEKRSTGLMLFDIYLEVGEYKKAYHLLTEFENKEDFDYLIRMAKWNDHLGNSEAVIRAMERAKSIAESRGVQDLLIWTYNNLATVYGHSGKIEKSYDYFLRSLKIQPDQVVPKRGIAWIVYSYEKDASEANRIMDSIMIRHISPDHLLFSSELAYFSNDGRETEKYRNQFIDLAENSDYGMMYLSDLVALYTEIDPIKSIDLAEMELENRATPLTYSLLAFAHLKNENIEGSLRIIEDHVQGKTFEPTALFYSALIYQKAQKNGMLLEVMDQLDEAHFELGPVRMRELDEMYKN